ncbi:MAG: hypothetical protein JSU07_13575 [Bacteroidetes bacterium]|nr:hypothetical protein [Bacteroidota bacterium]
MLSKFISLCIMFVTLTACNTEHKIKEAQIKRIDSLFAVLNLKQNELSLTDSTTLNKAITKYDNYIAFLTEKLNDTISKNEADNLQTFKNSGLNLEKIKSNFKVLNKRLLFVKNRLSELKQICTQENLPSKIIANILNEELNQISYLSAQITNYQKQSAVNIGAITSSLPGIEELIRQKNNGLLPIIISNTVSL